MEKINLLYIRFAQLNNCETGSETDASCDTNLPQVQANGDTLTTIIHLVVRILAGVALLIIVIQGLKFILSKGEPEKAAEARKGVIYSAIGLGVALLAEAIVTLFLGRLI